MAPQMRCTGGVRTQLEDIIVWQQIQPRRGCTPGLQGRKITKLASKQANKQASSLL